MRLEVRSIRKLFVFAAVILTALSIFTLAGCDKRVRTTVVTVGDGDSITVRALKSSVRLIGIDAPEIRAGSKPVGEYALEAQRFLEGLVIDANSKVALEVHGTDSYGRHLAYVYLPDGRMLNLELLKHGLARPLTYDDTSHHSRDMKVAYLEAFERRLGIFSLYDSRQVFPASVVRENLRPLAVGGFLGRIVWMEFYVTDVSGLSISGRDAVARIRKEEFDLFAPAGFSLEEFYRKTVQVFGEVWRDSSGKALILLRDPTIEIAASVISAEGNRSSINADICEFCYTF
jgi:micrococcal nuclease